MTKQQKTAIENPCEFPEECFHSRYVSGKQNGKLKFSVILTLNVGNE